MNEEMNNEEQKQKQQSPVTETNLALATGHLKFAMTYVNDEILCNTHKKAYAMLTKLYAEIYKVMQNADDMSKMKLYNKKNSKKKGKQS